MSNSVLFEDSFDVRQMNPDGKKFERVNRLHCHGATYDVELIIDVNAELFITKAGERITVALASSLSLDGTPDDGSYNANLESGSLMDAYDYVMHGRIFKIDHAGKHNVEISASFGGLLFKIKGEQSHLDQLYLDMQVYILMKGTPTSSKSSKRQ